MNTSWAVGSSCLSAIVSTLRMINYYISPHMLLSTTVKKSHTVTKKGCDDTRSAPLVWPSCSHIHVHVHSPQIKVLRWTRAMAPSVCTQTHLCPGKPTSQRATGTPCSCTSLRRPSLPASTVCVSSEARGAIPTLCSFQGRMLIVCGDLPCSQELHAN